MRTWLFVPGHDARKVQKALHSAADVVIIDWEDAVPPERKPEARATTRSIIAQESASPRCVVRVNSRHDPAFADDTAMLAELPISGVLLPKAASPADVIDLALAHRLVTKYTSFVAVDKTPVRVSDAQLKLAAVPTNLPDGWEYDKVFGELPQGATDSRFALLSGSIMLLLALAMLRRRTA